jgi:hypothetical protein
VLALLVFETFNFLRLRGWRQRAQGWGRARRAREVAVSFIVPTVILVAVFSQVKLFLGYRFNFTYQLQMMLTALTDLSVLLLVGTLPDYIQGAIKLAWVLGKSRVRG